MSPSCTINEFPSQTDTFAKRSSAVEGGKLDLEPGHKTSSHSMADYYVANDTKELISTFDGGYYYPETPLDLLKKPDQMKKICHAADLQDGLPRLLPADGTEIRE